MSITHLPNMEHVFTVKIKGSETGQVYEGTFKYKRPTLRIRSEISKTAALLNGGILGLDEDTAFTHAIFANLKHTLVETPEWWKKADYGFELYDLNVALDIYKQTQEFEKKWMDQVWKEESKEKKAKESSAKEE